VRRAARWCGPRSVGLARFVEVRLQLFRLPPACVPSSQRFRSDSSHCRSCRQSLLPLGRHLHAHLMWQEPTAPDALATAAGARRLAAPARLNPIGAAGFLTAAQTRTPSSEFRHRSFLSRAMRHLRVGGQIAHKLARYGDRDVENS